MSREREREKKIMWEEETTTYGNKNILNAAFIYDLNLSPYMVFIMRSL